MYIIVQHTIGRVLLVSTNVSDFMNTVGLQISEGTNFRDFHELYSYHKKIIHENL